MEPSQPPKFAKVMLPPVWVITFLLTEIALNYFLPIAELIPKPLGYIGVLLIAGGVGIAAWAALLFRKAKTGVVPFSETTALVSQGPYRVTRNPMYLGMTIVLLGVAVLLGSVSPFFCVPAFMLIITRLFIVYEEAHVERAMGQAYLEFKKHTRRWV